MTIQNADSWLHKVDYKMWYDTYDILLLHVRQASLKGHFTHMKLFFKITEIETLINITYIVTFLRSTDVSVFYY